MNKSTNHNYKKLVVHSKKEPYDVYIGRPSKWGNPFVIGKDGTRAEVVEKYKTYLLNNKELMTEISTLKDKVLGCFCSPLRCHGDAIVEVIQLLNKDELC